MDVYKERNRARVAAYTFAMDQQNILQQVREMVVESQNAMDRDANRHRSALTFNVGTRYSSVL
ncbi:hypothetical protein HF325_001665 [Metschnikowia pulcherrima]|uniref:Uncharacterized protein n=1 Tax=Metschnikowia pulcherrima TaxID=27326 RepID=A0A8H7GWI4_9ASCO|nr:hypothetical protein HF325_001665 [Metschnikowia pulcherrima]